MIHLLASLFLLSTLTARALWVTDGVPLEPSPAPAGAAFTNDVMPVGLFLCTNSEFQVGFQDPERPGRFVKMVGGESWGYALQIGGGVVGEVATLWCGEAGKLLVGDIPVVLQSDLGNASVQSAATANSAEYATSAGTADSANSASYANEAGSANTANYSADAGTAARASYADEVASLTGHSVSELNNDAGFIAQEQDPWASAQGFITADTVHEIISGRSFVEFETDPWAQSQGFATEANLINASVAYANEAGTAASAQGIESLAGHSVSELSNDLKYMTFGEGAALLVDESGTNILFVNYTVIPPTTNRVLLAPY